MQTLMYQINQTRYTLSLTALSESEKLSTIILKIIFDFLLIVIKNVRESNLNNSCF